MKRQVISRPMRLLWIIPIVGLASQFDDMLLSLLFTAALSIVTSRLFPINETLYIEKHDNK